MVSSLCFDSTMKMLKINFLLASYPIIPFINGMQVSKLTKKLYRQSSVSSVKWKVRHAELFVYHFLAQFPCQDVLISHTRLAVGAPVSVFSSSDVLVHMAG